MQPTSIWQERSVRVLVPILAAFGIIALAAYAYQAYTQSKYWMIGPVVINVVGEGEVVAQPDLGTFSFGVRAEAETADVALSSSAEQTKAILNFLRESGVADEDISTQSYNLNPTYSYESLPCPVGSFCPPRDPVIDGFEVMQMVSVKVRDLSNVGTLLSGVGERGATNISGLSFTIDDPEKLKADARAEAIANAQEQAERLAEQLGVRIVRMTGYFEEQPFMPGYGMGGYEERAMMDMAAVPEVPTGEGVVTSRVNVSYQVK